MKSGYLSINYIRYLHTISCLQITIIVCKQTSALHIIKSIKDTLKKIEIKIYNLYFLLLYIIVKVRIHYKRKKIILTQFVKLNLFTSSSLV